MESILSAAQTLVLKGEFPDVFAAREAILEVIEENRIPVTEDGLLNDLDYADIMYELTHREETTR